MRGRRPYNALQTMNDPILDSLREALRQSPGNTPLRLSVARMLAEAGLFDEALSEYKAGLEFAPHDVHLETGLAEVYHAQGKFSVAIVLCEGIINRGHATAQTHLALARAQHAGDDFAAATEAYRKAKELNPEVLDEGLEELLHGLPGIDTSGLELNFAGGDPDADFDPYRERPRIDFSAVGGMEDVKDEIRIKIIHPLTQPEIYAAYGKKIGGGILMFGPPGCGKTLLARATAGEVKASFINVSISDVLDMYIGNSERNLRDIFTKARSQKPCVLFFDEVDALAASRRDMRQSAGRQVINQFLAELDGVEANNEGVLIMAATNAPWHLDSAFRRPGRFDRIQFVPPPDSEARAAILKVQLADKPAGDVDVAAGAKKTKDFSGADLAALIESAVDDKLRVALKTGKPEPLTTKDFLKAAGRVKPSTKEWFTVARNHALYANEGGHYDDILAHLGIKK